MKIDLQSHSFPLTPALVAAVNARVETLKARFGNRIGSVAVHLDEVNGRRGGIDRRCRIIIGAAPRLTVVGQAFSSDLYHAIALAARRAETALAGRRAQVRTLRPPAPAPAAQGARM